MTGAFYKRIKPENLPMPDRQLMRLIQCTLDDGVEISTLTQLISTNPALTAQLLGVVNSAAMGFRQSIKTVSEALVAMGMKRLKNLILCFAVKETLSKNTIPGFDINSFWGDSVRRGVAAQQLGYLVNGPIEEAFSAGMLQDIGLLVLFSMEPAKADRWPLLRSNLPGDRRKMEKALFQTTHDTIGGLLVKRWHLPQSYAIAISCHHSFFDKKETQKFGKANKHSILAGMSHLADLCNAVYTCHDKTSALAGLRQKSKQLFGLEDDKIDSLLSLLPDQVKETTDAMKIQTRQQVDFSTVMDQANQKLVEDNISYQELTWKLQTSLKQRDEYAGKLETELGVAREIQQSLQPDIGQMPGVGAFNLPAQHLSGDFYDYFSKNNGTICFCLGDVSGKGTAAALLMAKTISLFRCLCKVGDDLNHIITMMNNELCETAVRGMFVTFVAGWLNPDTQRMELINLGHLPPILIHGKKVLNIQACGPPLGVLADIIPQSQACSLLNSRLFLYTDGFTEGRLKTGKTEEVGKELGFKGFLLWVAQSRHLTIDEQMAWIQNQCTKQLAPQSDDLTLMILSGETPT